MSKENNNIRLNGGVKHALLILSYYESYVCCLLFVAILLWFINMNIYMIVLGI